MITGIKITEKEFEHYKYAAEKPEVLDNLSRVNIFIGPNNSGKSMFMRGLFSIKKFEFINSYYKSDEIDNIIVDLKEDVNQTLSKWNINNYENVKLISAKIEKLEFVTIDFKQRVAKIKEQIQEMVDIRDMQTQLMDMNGNYINTSRVAADIRAVSLKAMSFLNRYLDSGMSDSSYERIYIPILRGLRPIGMVGGSNIQFDANVDPYKNRTAFDYFGNEAGSTNDYELIKNRIYTGLNIYKDVQDKLLSKKSDRENVKAFEDFLKKTFFNGQDVTLIPQVGKDVLLIGIDGDEKSIHQLGDGIQALIQILYPIFLYKGKHSLFLLKSLN